MLDFIPGTTTEHPAERDERGYALAAEMLRRLHDLTTGSDLAGADECVLHGDVGPFNTIFRDGMPVAFIDWDAAHPGSRWEDLGYFAWTWCVQGVADIPIGDQARRLADVHRGYGVPADVDLVDVVVRSLRTCAEGWAAKASGSEGHERDRHLSAVAWAERDLAHLLEHESAFRAALP